MNKLKFFTLGLFLLNFTGLFCQVTPMDSLLDVLENQDSYFDSYAGVKVSFESTPEIFPVSWRGGAIKGEVIPIEKSERRRCHLAVSLAFSKYPEGFPGRFLSAVYFAKDFIFYGVGYGGTNSLSEVYIANSGLMDGYTLFYIEKTFHHEFSSVMLRTTEFPLEKKGWLKDAPGKFEYGKGGVEEIRNGYASQELNDSLAQYGFLHQYALSSMENDFNAYAENLFIPDPGFWELVDNYPAVKRKAKIVSDFYESMDTGFSWERFRSFASRSRYSGQ